MNSLQLLADALDVARQLGFEIREEPLGEGKSGACRIRGRKLLLLDSQLGPRERLERVLDAIRDAVGLEHLSVRPALKHLLARAKPAA